MKRNQTLPYLIIAALLVFIGFQQCSPGRDKNIPISSQDSVKKHIISIDSASRLTANFRTGKTLLARQLKDSRYLDSAFNLPNAESFNRDAIAALLNAPDAKGIRIYLGKDGRNLIRLVLVPVNAKGQDIIVKLVAYNKPMHIPGVTSAYAYGVVGDAIEAGQRCPTLCDDQSPLDQQ